MARILIGNMRGVERGSTATIDIPIRAYYNYFTLETRGGFSSGGNLALEDHRIGDAIQELRILINGATIWRVTGEMICIMNSYFTSFQQADGIFPIYFARDWLRTSFGVNSSRLASHLAGRDGKITMEVDWKSGYYPRTVEVRANHEERNRLGVQETAAYRGFKKVTRNHASASLEQIPSGEFAGGAEIVNALFIVSPLLTRDNRHAVLDDIQIFSNGNKLYDTNHSFREIEEKLLGRGAPSLRTDDEGGSSGIRIPNGFLAIEFSDKNLIGNAFTLDDANLSLELNWLVAPGQYTMFLDMTNTAAFNSQRRIA